MEMKNDYTQFKIENYILKITGIFGYDKSFQSKSLNFNYKEVRFSDDEIRFNKDYFYPEFRNQFFVNNNKRHSILTKENFECSIVDLFIMNYDGISKSKNISFTITESRLDLFDDGFGLFTLNLKINSENLSLSDYSDAAFLCRNFEAQIEHTNYRYWHQFIEGEILLGISTRGNSIKIDDFSGSKYKLFMVLDVPELEDKQLLKSLLFDIGTLGRIGSAINTTYDSLDKNYISALIKNNVVSVYNNWESLTLLDTMTFVGKGILDAKFKHLTYHNNYYIIYLYCLFIKYSLQKFNFEITDLNEDRRNHFQNYLNKYFFNDISYNFLPTEIFNKIKVALNIDNELTLLNNKIVAVGQKVQEKQQEKTNKILGIVTVLSSLSSIQPVYDYMLAGQKWLGWNSALYWTVALALALAIVLGIGFYVFGQKAIKWIKKVKI